MNALQTVILFAGSGLVIWAGMWASRGNKRQSGPRRSSGAGWECFACGHVERCTRRETFWKDVGATLSLHGFENHPDGHDYALHVPKGWERKTRRPRGDSPEDRRFDSEAMRAHQRDADEAAERDGLLDPDQPTRTATEDHRRKDTP